MEGGGGILEMRLTGEEQRDHMIPNDSNHANHKKGLRQLQPGKATRK